MPSSTAEISEVPASLPKQEEQAQATSYPFPAGSQHSRSNSVQSSTSTVNDDADDANAAAATAGCPALIKRDMDFFMARLTRTSSSSSTI